MLLVLLIRHFFDHCISCQFKVGLNTDFITNRNTRTYFDPLLSLGSTAGVGIGSQDTHSVLLVEDPLTNLSLHNSLIPGHGFRTGQKLL